MLVGFIWLLVSGAMLNSYHFSKLLLSNKFSTMIYYAQSPGSIHKFCTRTLVQRLGFPCCFFRDALMHPMWILLIRTCLHFISGSIVVSVFGVKTVLNFFNHFNSISWITFNPCCWYENKCVHWIFHILNDGTIPDCCVHLGYVTRSFTNQNEVKFTLACIAGGAPCASVHSQCEWVTHTHWLIPSVSLFSFSHFFSSSHLWPISLLSLLCLFCWDNTVSW